MGHLKVAAIASVIVVVIVVGGMHIVRGRKVHNWLGVQVCLKERWTLDDTFMNTDDYVGQPIRVAELDIRVIRALIGCGVLRIKPPRSKLVPGSELGWADALEM